MTAKNKPIEKRRKNCHCGETENLPCLPWCPGPDSQPAQARAPKKRRVKR